MKPTALLVILTTCLLQFSTAQIKDSTSIISMVSLNFGFDIPAADMAKRFGPNLKTGGTYNLKLKNFMLLGADFGFIFSEKPKETGIFDSIKTSSGVIINQFGELSRIKLSERGFYAGIKIGKLVPRFGPNPHCGFIATFSFGYLQHKIRIDNDGNNTPQILNNYTKGYDRLTSGFAMQQFAGYMFMNNKGTYNFYGGFEFTQGFTKSRRSWDFDLQRRDTKQRLDLLFGFKIGWIIPLYRHMANNQYYYY